MEFDTVRALLD